MPRCVIKFKDGSHCNLTADCIVEKGEYIQVWYGEYHLVGIFLLSEVCAAYLTEKLICKGEKGEEDGEYKRKA